MVIRSPEKDSSILRECTSCVGSSSFPTGEYAVALTEIGGKIEALVACPNGHPQVLPHSDIAEFPKLVAAVEDLMYLDASLEASRRNALVDRHLSARVDSVTPHPRHKVSL